MKLTAQERARIGYRKMTRYRFWLCTGFVLIGYPLQLAGFDAASAVFLALCAAVLIWQFLATRRVRS